MTAQFDRVGGSPAPSGPNSLGKSLAPAQPSGQGPWSSADSDNILPGSPPDVFPAQLGPTSFGAPPQPVKGKLPPWAIALIAVGSAAAVLLVVMIGAAIAVPVFPSQRHKAAAAATTITLPDQIAGFPRDRSPEAARLAAGILRPTPVTSDNMGAQYTDVAGERVAFIGVARFKKDASAEYQQSFLHGIWKGIRNSAGGTSLETPVTVDPGPLGGTAECALSRTQNVTTTFCAVADRTTAMMTAMLTSSGLPDMAFVQTARSAVVHRS